MAKMESFTIGYRATDVGHIKVLVRVLLVLTIIIGVGSIGSLIGALLIMKNNPNTANVLFVIVGMFGFLTVVAVLALIYEYNAFKKNAQLKNNCIEYDGENHLLVLCTIKGDIIKIKPEAYVKLEDNFNTENRLMFTYKLEDGSQKKVNLGFCSNREELREKIASVINGKENN